MDHHRVVIIGAGAAGYTAAIYTARASLKTTVIGGQQLGGQLSTTSEVENFPGFPEGIMGPDLMSKMQEQAKKFGAELIYNSVDNIDMEARPFTVFCGSQQYQAEAIILATGASARWLGIPGEQKYVGKGYSSCATCDGFFFRGKEVMIVGGGDSAMEEANFLTKFANKVFVVHRGDSLRASKIMQDRAMLNPKIEFIWNSAIIALHGDTVLEKVTLQDTQTGKEKEMLINGVFVAIGHTPNTGFVKGKITLNEAGYIVPATRTMTNVEGVFAAGDVVDMIYRQAISAAGDGCRAAIDCVRWLEGQYE
jgi:thioredoxin reductase (NADPH)